MNSSPRKLKVAKVFLLASQGFAVIVLVLGLSTMFVLLPLKLALNNRTMAIAVNLSGAAFFLSWLLTISLKALHDRMAKGECEVEGSEEEATSPD